MRLIAVMVAKPGQQLARAIKSEEGTILLNKGARLTEKLIGRLKGIGVSFIYIQDDQIQLPEIEQVISTETREYTINQLKKDFIDLANEWKKNANHFSSFQLNLEFEDAVRLLIGDIKSKPNALTLLLSATSHDHYIFTHSFNVTVYSIGLAVELNYSERQLLEVGLGALLHDIGKMSTPLEILEKPGKLTKEEFEIVKTHSKIGYDLLRQTKHIPLQVAKCAHQHHERLNGTGYPQGLKEDEIHPYAKIIAIADVFDAVTTNRVYRKKPMLPHEALELLYSGASTLFDLSLVTAFRKTIAVYPIGLMVTLSDNRKGVVFQQNREMSTHPIIKVLYEDGVKLEVPYFIDLMKHLNITIIGTDAFEEQS
ncbi:hisitidine kinase [Alkalihalobacillus alcalophilus ATCC 27647 = CGMCC 1.3604]|uniref:Hisitidine kinase n=1 Tax=Alkalihalobacillus alcalophilus ATCC 27647 = CGMCC 1.3604 TaxID=1218173 RepID=A0A094WHW9_ALKAL|nr:HD-GYP domain-containing protein [Alkalihalobacillus alcalophilus]KGA96406.1 histidine kinase [Alkalihalobacillus alcalophilus ATCC 27647 = CGMCC 1.3604]MED1560467.1 HD-GYP domain-containing protein [Alkalihalobacillus alcalophilus]THG90858.1 hisitidine kinase [Alkalihalobacillus alcalophilus ATCC 27647 = CGMCC 1.3604]